MRLIGGTIGAVIGGAIGAAIWIAVSYFANFEIGWIAWGVGVLCGFGFAIGSGRVGGPGGAVIAVGVALLSLVVGRIGSVALAVNDAYQSDDIVTGAIADVIEHERRRNGQNVPPGQPDGQAESYADLWHPSIWQEAQRRYALLPEQERDEIMRCPELADPDWLTIWVADEVIGEMAAAGEDLGTLDWPPHIDIAMEDPWWREDYPTDIWRQAEARLAAMAPADRAQYEADSRAYLLANFSIDQAAMMEAQTRHWLSRSFSPFDVLWVILAVLSAARLGGQRGDTGGVATA
jgi:hypothetical protein